MHARRDHLPFPWRHHACGYCGAAIPAGHALCALVPDSSVIDHEDPSCDGRRHVVACGSAHLDLLIGQANDAWIPEERWLGQLCRASMQPGSAGATVAQLGARARMPTDHVRRAVLWNSRREAPLRALPGGQVLSAADLETMLGNR
ncbi:hypothetical protein [Amycolatopsis sp. CA-230715]|uniref:hypothetical protein n=1 Tax=Amycolatopsis sp. CA-230715 TaxID=2745196 RepID=UPI001C017F39|nr:hypothetical protein [Amycolatopsis sp. CA-230715]QWF84477.1 hypothetical protein HUW46_07927 [Amycolatopsis sp. CA-230715]